MRARVRIPLSPPYITKITKTAFCLRQLRFFCVYIWVKCNFNEATNVILYTEVQQHEGESTIFLIGFILIILGIAGAVFPRAMWYMSEGWKFKDAEPSEFYLIMNRVMGVVFAIIGFYLLFY